MLMGANGIYADGRAQPMTANGILLIVFLFYDYLNCNRTFQWTIE